MKKSFYFVALFAVASACQSASTDTTQASDTTASEVVVAADAAPEEQPYAELCFLEAIGKDSTIVNIAIQGDSVTGEMKWQPYEKDGAVGILKGKISGQTITADYVYTIEGSEQVEEKIFVLYEDKMIEKRGPLEDKNGKLVLKDPTKTTDGAILKKVDCKL